MWTQSQLNVPQGTIKATVLVETILAAFEMDEILDGGMQCPASEVCGTVRANPRGRATNSYFITPFEPDPKPQFCVASSSASRLGTELMAQTGEIRAIERTDSVRQRVHAEISRLIVRGALAPGSNITERQLATELGVSRTPVREALVSLERDGLVYSDPVRGFFIQPLTLEEVEETYPILWNLEQMALRITRLFGSTQLNTLRDLNARMSSDGVDPEKAVDLDNEWHRLLVSACGNQRLIDIIARMKDLIRRYEFAYMRSEGLGKHSVEQHSEIIAALDANDINSAQALLEENFVVSLHHFRDRLAARPEDADDGSGAVSSE